MTDHEMSSTKHQRGTHLDSSSRQSINPERSEDYHKYENRSDREYDSYDSHGSLRASREEHAPRQRHPQADRIIDRGRHSRYESNDNTSDRSHHRHDRSEGRRSGSAMKHYHSWTPHDRPETINSYYHEREGHRTTYPSAADERRRSYPPVHRQLPFTVEKPHERYDRKDEPDLRKLVHEKRRYWDNEHLQKNYKCKEEEQEYRSPACAHPYSSSNVTSLKATHKFDQDNTDDLDEQTEQHRSPADRYSEHHHRRRHHYHNSSHGRSSSRGSSFHSSSSASDDSNDTRGTGTFKEGSSRRRPSRHHSRRRSPSRSRSHPRSESHHRGRSRSRSRSRSPSKNHSSVKNYSRSSYSRKHSGDKRKRKHKDRSASHDRKRRKRKEREREKDKDIGREKEREKEKAKKDEERRSVLTGKKIKLKVKKDKSDHERDANRKDLLQFLNSAFE